MGRRQTNLKPGPVLRSTLSLLASPPVLIDVIVFLMQPWWTSTTARVWWTRVKGTPGTSPRRKGGTRWTHSSQNWETSSTSCRRPPDKWQLCRCAHCLLHFFCIVRKYLPGINIAQLFYLWWMSTSMCLYLYHEKGLVKTIQTIPQNLYVCSSQLPFTTDWVKPG